MRAVLLVLILAMPGFAVAATSAGEQKADAREQVVIECLRRAELASKDRAARPAYLAIMDTMTAAEQKRCHDLFFSRFKH